MSECLKCGDKFEDERRTKIHYGLVHEGSLSKTTIKCDRCGETTERRKTVIEDNDEVFCSRECKYDTKQSCKCKVCGETFEEYRYRIKKGKGKYCSLECRNESYKEGELYECAECGEEVYRPPLQAKKYDNKFCSHQCQTDYISGEEHYKYKEDKRQYTYSGGWKTARQERLEKDNYECQECGETENLHIHHIQPYIKFEDKFEANRQENLITLCSSCHLQHEKGGKELRCLNETRKP